MNLQCRRVALCLIAAGMMLAACGPSRPSIGGPFELTDQNGQSKNQSILKGKWSAVFFGYTYCPDICPATLQTLADAQERLGTKAARFQVVFITVDPARDTPAQLKAYLSSSAFPHGAIGLTGTEAQVSAAAKAYYAYHARAGTGPNYTVEHSSAIYLMDPRGRFNRVVAFGMTPDEVARQISDAMQGA